MRADPFAQLKLLDLQQVDSSLDRIAHRRRTLPELARIADLSDRLAVVNAEIAASETADRDLGREQARIEGDVDVVRSRMVRDQERLDSGAVSSPRELENLQSEIASLQRRQSELEDQVLEVMERRESAGTQRVALEAERDQTTAGRTAAEQARDAAYADMEREAQTLTARRAELVGQLPADLLALYERVREQAGGVGAAALYRGRCEGCHLQLNTVELNGLRDAPSDEVVRCEECRRILIRTDESGL